MNAISTADGSTVWQIVDSAWDTGSGASVANGVVYFPGGNGVLEAADASTGTVLWQGPTAVGNPSTSVTVADGQLLFETVGANEGQAFSFQLPT